MPRKFFFISYRELKMLKEITLPEIVDLQVCQPLIFISLLAGSVRPNNIFSYTVGHQSTKYLTLWKPLIMNLFFLCCCCPLLQDICQYCSQNTSGPHE